MPDAQMHLREATVQDAERMAFVEVASQVVIEGWRDWTALPLIERVLLLCKKTVSWTVLVREQPITADCAVVAEDAIGQLVGCAAGGRSVYGPRAEGELSHLYVLPGFQRQGIGRLLVRAVAQRLHEKGRRSLLVRADGAACSYFEHTLRGTALGEQPGLRGMQSVYRWDDISQLLS